ncbi:cytochrome P450 [Boletus reticuloceps]|uniref:Cytochrome P450 n=1 Tax=Boletus reticuloceps TaxID=495285 RepID=A0A8I3AAH0_9AGAM|nr:cytochrome P450 [Boletus reticuloceps]
MAFGPSAVVCAALALAFGWAAYHVTTHPRGNPLRKLAGPPVRTLFGSHMPFVLDPAKSPKTHAQYIEKYGRNVRVRGLGPWDDRLLPLDPVSVSHVLKNSAIYEKPWQSRRMISGLIGCGMLAAEGHVHRRQRRVATPAFSIQNLRALVPLVFRKGNELRDKWAELVDKPPTGEEGIEIDVCHWISRATFDVIGLAGKILLCRCAQQLDRSTGFDYHFNAIQNESDELFCAYKEMFEIAITQNNGYRTVLGLYFPILDLLFVSRHRGASKYCLIYFFAQPNERVKTVKRCHAVINRIAGKLIQSKKTWITECEKSGTGGTEKDLLSLLIKSNMATDLSPDQQISDEDILHTINTFMFAGSDTTSLALTWTLLLLARHPEIQTRLRAELLNIMPSTPLSRLTTEEIESLYTILSDHHYLNNVVRESLRLIPPVHSSLRVATRDDEMPTSYPVHLRDGSISDHKSISIQKGDFVHIPIEAFNLDSGIWGDTAWQFDPDRWDHLPEAVASLPGLYSNLLTFSAGPRSCIGMRFSMIEMKTFLYVLLTNFTFAETEKKIFKMNVVLTRPYVSGQGWKGSQCPLLVKKIAS